MKAFLFYPLVTLLLCILSACDDDSPKLINVCASRVPDEYTPCPVSIYEAKDLNSTNEGRLVQVEGILMAKRFDDGNLVDREWAIQVSPRDASYRNAENSGIWVDLTQALVVVEANIGDLVRVQGEVDQSSGYRIIARAKTTEKLETQLVSPTPIMVNAMDIMTNGNAVRQYEGMLVTVSPVRVDANQFPAVAGDSDPNGEFSINGLSVDNALYHFSINGLRVDNALYNYPMPQVGQSWEKMTGILKFNLGDAKLLPRSPEDYVYLGNQDDEIQDLQMPSFTDQLIDAAVVEIEDQFLEPDLMVDLGPLTVNSIIPNRGSVDGATDVQIIGTGFSPTTVFTFDRIICQEIEVLNKNKAKCKTPANPVGEVDVKALDSRVENGMQVPYQGFLEKGFQYYIPLEVDEITPNKGAIYGGLRVTFSGRGFENPTQVKFGGIRSTEVVINENNTLTVTVPQAQVAGFVDVSVSNLNGQINLPSAFYYYEPLSLDQVVPAVGSSQGGTRVVLQGTGFRADSNILFNDRPAQILGGSSTTLEVSTPSGNVGYADIKISNQNGELLKTRAFLYYDSQSQDFSVIGLQPQSGSVNGGETIYIAGSGFDAQTTVYFDGALISCTLENAYQLNCTTPPGIAGTIGVEVRKGNQNLSAGDYRYFQNLELFSIFPDKGSIAGGTVVTLNGRGFVAGMEVLLGDQPLLDLQIQDEFTVIGTTQPAPLSTVDVIAKTADRQQRLIGGYQYFDPTSGFGGVWGSELDAAINVTVLHATSQMPLAEVDVFLITNDGNLQLSGQTNASGQVTLSSENLRGLVDITAAKEGFEVTTIENTAVENVTIFLVPNTSEMGPQPPGVPPAILRGTVRGLDLLPKPNNETFVNLVIVETTHDNLTNRGDLPPPGPGGVLLEDGPFEITSRLGELAVIATAGRILRSVYVQFQNGEIDHMTFREQLEPISMGMRRFISAREGEEINGLHIEIDHPLDFIIPVDLDNPPLDRVNGPSVYAVLPILNLGGEGFWQFYGTAVDLTPNLSLNLMPRLAGWEDDLRYYFVGLAINPNSQSQSPLTITTHQTRDVAAGVLITPFVSPAKPINPVEDGTLGVDRLLAWSNYEGFDGNPTAPAEAMVVSISEPAFGPPKPLWKYVVPPGINQVEIPVLPTTAGEGTGLNGGAMILQMNPFISESGFNYRDFNYFDINGSRWKSWGVTQFFFNE